MTTSNLIPNGRTSRVKKGETSLQVQTEYAYRPYPRLTTTVLNDGQVLHKIEKKLDRPIGSVEEQSEIERMIKRQHSDVVSIIEENVAGKPATFEVPAEFVPQRFGYNHILLNPVDIKDGKSHKITARLSGGPCEDESADWRFGFCVITADGKPRYTDPTAAGHPA